MCASGSGPLTPLSAPTQSSALPEQPVSTDKPKIDGAATNAMQTSGDNLKSNTQFPQKIGGLITNLSDNLDGLKSKISETANKVAGKVRDYFGSPKTTLDAKSYKDSVIKQVNDLRLAQTDIKEFTKLSEVLDKLDKADTPAEIFRELEPLKEKTDIDANAQSVSRTEIRTFGKDTAPIRDKVFAPLARIATAAKECLASHAESIKESTLGLLNRLRQDSQVENYRTATLDDLKIASDNSSPEVQKAVAQVKTAKNMGTIYKTLVTLENERGARNNKVAEDAETRLTDFAGRVKDLKKLANPNAWVKPDEGVGQQAKGTIQTTRSNLQRTQANTISEGKLSELDKIKKNAVNNGDQSLRVSNQEAADSVTQTGANGKPLSKADYEKAVNQALRQVIEQRDELELAKIGLIQDYASNFEDDRASVQATLDKLENVAVAKDGKLLTEDELQAALAAVTGNAPTADKVKILMNIKKKFQAEIEKNSSLSQGTKDSAKSAIDHIRLQENGNILSADDLRERLENYVSSLGIN